MSAEAGEIVSIVGANGAGKSTLLKSIMGLVRTQGGEIVFEGTRVTGVAPHTLVAMGIAYVPEGRRLFPEMTVRENLRMGAPRRCPEVHERLKVVHDLFPVLEERSFQLVTTLSGGEQQMVAIARALMAKPKMLLLDEPSLGLSPIAFEKVIGVIEKINREGGVAVLLAEQSSERAMEISDRTYVLENGRVAGSGLSDELLHDPMVRAAYLGVGT
ncbi:MAG: ABC transporter ATP-binding protein [Thaumarchaeota archaeon]|nr:MAG: ABC transporter ATP-binding protein [Nitrososphaerota archaeon]